MKEQLYLDTILYGKKGKYDPEDKTGYGFKTDKKGKKNKKKDKDKREKLPEIKNDEDLIDAVMDDVKKEKKRAKKEAKKERERQEDRRSPRMKEIDDIIISM